MQLIQENYHDNQQIYSTREELVRREISINDAIQLIQKYGGEYDSSNINFDVYDQLLACESTAESSPIITTYYQNNEENNLVKNVNVNGSVNDSCKQLINVMLTEDKLNIIARLKTLTYKTSPIDIAELLDLLFKEYPCKSGHWLYIAQHWPPRPICRVINRLINLQMTGRITVRNFSAYFTFLIKKRAPRTGWRHL